MKTARVAVLGVLVAVVVCVFLVAPDDGRLARVPVMVLVGVLAVLWYLIATSLMDRSTAAVPQPGHEVAADPATTQAAGATDGDVIDLTDRGRAGYFEVESAVAGTPRAGTPVHHEDDLSLLPDPPANWPPISVEVPSVFSGGGPDTATVAPVIDVVDVSAVDAVDASDAVPEAAGASSPEQAGIAGGEDAAPVESMPGPAVLTLLTDRPHAANDPWLAWAAEMFAD